MIKLLVKKIATKLIPNEIKPLTLKPQCLRHGARGPRSCAFGRYGLGQVTPAVGPWSTDLAPSKTIQSKLSRSNAEGRHRCVLYGPIVHWLLVPGPRA